MKSPVRESEWRAIATVEGLALLGGVGEFRLAARASSGLVYEVHYPTGVRSPEHRHDHDSVVYLMSGLLRSCVDGREQIVRPGDTAIHPMGILHSVEAIHDSRWLEFKSPLPKASPLSPASG